VNLSGLLKLNKAAQPKWVTSFWNNITNMYGNVTGRSGSTCGDVGKSMCGNQPMLSAGGMRMGYGYEPKAAMATTGSGHGDERLVKACAYLEANADQMGDVAERIREVYCSGGPIPKQHPVFCLVSDQAAEIAELREMLGKDCAVECSQVDGEQAVSECIAACEPMKEQIGAAVDALQAFVDHMGTCGIMPSPPASRPAAPSPPASRPAAPAPPASRSGGQEGGMIPQVPHYEPFEVIRILPHVPVMKPKEGTRLHYHGEPIDLTSVHGAAFDYETAGLRVGSTVCRADEILVDGKCRNRFIFA
jgi:hypothetical protein